MYEIPNWNREFKVTPRDIEGDGHFDILNCVWGSKGPGKVVNIGDSGTSKGIDVRISVNISIFLPFLENYLTREARISYFPVPGIFREVLCWGLGFPDFFAEMLKKVVY